MMDDPRRTVEPISAGPMLAGQTTKPGAPYGETPMDRLCASPQALAARNTGRPPDARL